MKYIPAGWKCNWGMLRAMIASKLRLYHRVQLAAHRLRKQADRTVLEAAGISTAQSAVLGIVAAGENVTQRDLAIALGLNDSAITAMATRLIKLGLLERRRSDADSRAWLLAVTEHGQAMQRAARAAFSGINKRIEGDFSADEIAQLAGLLQRLSRTFDEAAEG